MFRENPVKRRLRQGRPVVGCWLGMGSPVAAEILGLAGYDLAMIDNEHGPAALGDSVALLQALGAASTAAFMRVPWNDPVYVKRALDIGIEGIMFPSISSADEARAAVSACRYPPQGIRGYAAGMVRAADYGMSKVRYAQTAADTLMVLCQIESAQAVEAVPDIAQVPGVDMLFIGPYDLSASVGKLGRFDDPQVRGLIRRAERAILDSGRWYGTIPFAGRPMDDLLADGCHMILAGSDVGFIRDGALAQVSAFRAAAGTGSGAD